MGRFHIDPDYPIDSLWDIFYQHIGGLMNSHFYDILTYSGALGVCILMFFVRKHCKKKWVNILLASFLSFGFYTICAIFSFRLRMNSNWTLVAFVAPMAYMTILELLRREWIYRVIVYSSALFIIAYNYIYCIINEDHHKMCYAFKWFIIAFGIGGYVKNIVEDVKRKKLATAVMSTGTAEKPAEILKESDDNTSEDKNNSGTSSDIPESDDPNN